MTEIFDIQTLEYIITAFKIIGNIGIVIICIMAGAILLDLCDTGSQSDTTHHDHRKGSFYSISQQVRRDEKKRRGY